MENLAVIGAPRSITIKDISIKEVISAPRFVDKTDLTEQALSDPDYRLKLLQARYGGTNTISCSKCHHCR